ncbi:MAG: xanthine dehydrogenase family protein subunit M [Candidatus Thermoplasmatota archaeon]|nr:xanthine dehydrogenase family protein subunit M [Candidatus Thermoplasmatota archaeon]
MKYYSIMTLTPSKLQYIRPDGIDDAIEILSSNDANIKVLGGGQSLIPLLKTRIVKVEKLVDIGNIESLNYIKSKSGEIRIGAATRISQLVESELIQKRIPALYDACVMIADPLVRNMGTVGGNISHADPGNDIPVVALALGATIVAVGKSGERVIGPEDFFKGPFETSLSYGEIVREIVFPDMQKNQGSSFTKVKKMSGDFSVATSASFVTTDEGGSIKTARIAVSSATPVPTRLMDMENYVTGKKINDAILDHVRKNVTNGLDIMEDQTIDPNFRKYCVSDSAMKSLEKAYGRAIGR